MELKQYKVINGSAGSICLVGQRRVEIPGNAETVISLPVDTARATISRLKNRYPLLKISEYVAGATAQPVEQATPVQPVAQPVEAPKAENKPEENQANSEPTESKYAKKSGK